MSKLKIEQAKSNRSACKSCHLKIERGCLRIGKPYDYKGQIAFSWTHLRCAKEAVAADALDGYSDLTAEGKAEARRHFDHASHQGECVQNDSPGVYVLKLRDEGYYYVGKSERVSKRIAEHATGGSGCAKWVTAHGGVAKVMACVTPATKELGNWEMNETLAWMMRCGVQKVRGFEWTSSGRLSRDDLVTIKAMCCGMADLCRKCGLPGHTCTVCTTPAGERARFMNECEEHSDAGSRPSFGRSTKGVLQRIVKGQGEKKKQRRGAANAVLPPPKRWKVTPGSCFRCGRKGHYASACYAKSDVNGFALDDDDDDDDDGGSFRGASGDWS